MNLSPSNLRRDWTEAELQSLKSSHFCGIEGLLTPTQTAYLNDYVTDSKLNSKLRLPDGIRSLTIAEARMFLAIERAILLRGQRESHVRMWRGIVPAYADSVLQAALLAQQTGNRFRERGIQSYSLQPSVAGLIAGESGLVLELDTRQGLYISGVTQGIEEEVIHSDGATFEVKGLLKNVTIQAANGEEVSVMLIQLGD